VNVESSVLPTGAATSAAQATLLTELQAKLETADLELVASILSQGPHGWIGGAWQRNPLAFGYSGEISEDVTDGTLAVGNVNIDISTVPAGEIWVITQISMLYVGTVPSRIRSQIVRGGIDFAIFDEVAILSNAWFDRQGWWVLVEGDILRMFIQDATLNDTGAMRVTGFRVDIDQ